MSKDYFDGLGRALEIAKKINDQFWNEEFGRHGNKGLCAMKGKVGQLIEDTIRKEIVK